MTNKPKIDKVHAIGRLLHRYSESRWSVGLISVLVIWGVSDRSWSGVEVIYIPRDFPLVCAWSISENRPHCPDGVTEQPAPFCQQRLPGLDLARSALGFPDCSGETMPNPFLVPVQDSIVKQILLVDDVGASAELLGLLRPVVADSMVQPQVRLFRNQAGTITTEVLVVGEALYSIGGPANGPVPETQWRSRVSNLLRGDSNLHTEQNPAPPWEPRDSRTNRDGAVGDAGPRSTGGASGVPACYRFVGDVPLVVDSGDAYNGVLHLSCEDRDSDLHVDYPPEILLANYQPYPAWEAYIIASLVRRGYDPEQARQFVRASDGFRDVHTEFGSDEDIDPCKTSLWLEVSIKYRRDGSLRPVVHEFPSCSSDAGGNGSASTVIEVPPMYITGNLRRSEKLLDVRFDGDYAHWRGRVGAALARWMVRDRATGFANRSEGLRRLHGELRDGGTNNGELFQVKAVLYRREDQRVEAVAFKYDNGFE